MIARRIMLRRVIPYSHDGLHVVLVASTDEEYKAMIGTLVAARKDDGKMDVEVRLIEEE